MEATRDDNLELLKDALIGYEAIYKEYKDEHEQEKKFDENRKQIIEIDLTRPVAITETTNYLDFLAKNSVDSRKPNFEQALIALINAHTSNAKYSDFKKNDSTVIELENNESEMAFSLQSRVQEFARELFSPSGKKKIDDFNLAFSQDEKDGLDALSNSSNDGSNSSRSSSDSTINQPENNPQHVAEIISSAISNIKTLKNLPGAISEILNLEGFEKEIAINAIASHIALKYSLDDIQLHRVIAETSHPQDYSHLSEDEQIARLAQMSLDDAQEETKGELPQQNLESHSLLIRIYQKAESSIIRQQPFDRLRESSSIVTSRRTAEEGGERKERERKHDDFFSDEFSTLSPVADGSSSLSSQRSFKIPRIQLPQTPDGISLIEIPAGLSNRSISALQQGGTYNREAMDVGTGMATSLELTETEDKKSSFEAIILYHNEHECDMRDFFINNFSLDEKIKIIDEFRARLREELLTASQEEKDIISQQVLGCIISPIATPENNIGITNIEDLLKMLGALGELNDKIQGKKSGKEEANQERIYSTSIRTAFDNIASAICRNENLTREVVSHSSSGSESKGEIQDPLFYEISSRVQNIIRPPAYTRATQTSNVSNDNRRQQSREE